MRTRDYNGDLSYNKNCIVGIFDNYEGAKTSLIEQMKKLKYDYDGKSQNMFIKCWGQKNQKLK